jgi:hypothetical protein
MSLDSTLIEKALEYQLTGAIIASLLRRGHRYEVLHSICDRDGYDVVIEAKGIIRHIQLKATVEGGKRAKVSLHTALARKPSGCAVTVGWNPQTLQPTSFRFFGAAPGAPLPDLGGRISRHSRGNSEGTKGLRPDHRDVAMGRFERICDLDGLIDRLFGPEKDATIAQLMTHMASTPRLGTGHWLDAVRAGDFTAIPAKLDWDSSADLAHLIDGYALAAELGHCDTQAFLEVQNIAASETNVWPGNAADLWTTLFLEHHRWRQGGVEPDLEARTRLDMLAHQLREALTQ